MKARQAEHQRIATTCRVLGVSPSGYYAWRHRPLSDRARADVTMAAQVEAIHGQSRARMGRRGCTRSSGLRAYWSAASAWRG